MRVRVRVRIRAGIRVIVRGFKDGHYLVSKVPCRECDEIAGGAEIQELFGLVVGAVLKWVMVGVVVFFTPVGAVYDHMHAS